VSNALVCNAYIGIFMKISELKKTAIIAGLLGIGLLIIFCISGNVPHRSNLTKIEGQIDWVKATGKRGDTIRFKFKESDIHLVYHSIGKQTSKVHSALAQRDALITILYDHAEPHRPPFDDNEYYTIYEIVQNGVIVRSHEVLVEKYAENSRLAGWMGLACLILSGLIFLTDSKRKRAN